MEDVTLADAKEHLEDLLTRAAGGETVSIIDPLRGTFRLQQVTPARRQPPILGQWAGKLTVPARLFEPLTKDELAWISGEQSH